MLLDFEAGDSVPRNCDIVVIGAGAVGLTMAVWLARDGRKVLLIESGGTAFESAAQDLNFSRSVGLEHDGGRLGRVRALGGTTTLWGGQVGRFSPLDFEKRQWIELSGWPISLADLEPSYKSVYEILKLKPISAATVWKKLGTPQPPASPDICLFLTDWLPETNFRILFWNDIRTNPNLHCVFHATATGLEWSPADGRVTGVEIQSQRGRREMASGRSVVVATGTLEASRLMMTVAHRNKDVPWASNPWLGACFHDHLDGKVASITPLNGSKFSAMFDNIYVFGRKFQPKLGVTDLAQKKLQCLNIAGSVIFESSVRENLERVKHLARSFRKNALAPGMMATLSGSLRLAGLLFRMTWRYLLYHRAFNPADKGIFLNVHCEQAPDVQSRLTLDDGVKDALGMPGLKIHWRYGHAELTTIALFAETVGRFLEERDLAKVSVFEDVKRLDTAAFGRMHDSYHPGGGLRMASDGGRGVVDQNLQVFGTGNLFVAGAAVFPTAGQANSTLTAMALGLRLAYHLAAVPEPAVGATIQ